MPFIKKQDQKSLTLPSLIDVVFLLLIYSLVTIPMYEWPPVQEFPLPHIQSPKTQDAEAMVKNLIIQIENEIQNDPQSPRVVYVLLPSQPTITQAKDMALQTHRYASISSDSIRTLSDSEFRNSRVCQLIQREIQNYIARYRERPLGANKIEIRAVRNTEFRLLNFILKECSTHGDTVPSIAVRTLSQTE